MGLKTDKNKKEKQDDFLDALRITLGNISTACEKAGISRRTYYDWMEHEAFRDRCEDVNERTVDLVEGELLKNIRSGNVTAQVFYLKSKGKKRGYVERTELDQTINDHRKTISDLFPAEEELNED